MINDRTVAIATLYIICLLVLMLSGLLCLHYRIRQIDRAILRQECKRDSVAVELESWLRWQEHMKQIGEVPDAVRRRVDSLYQEGR